MKTYIVQLDFSAAFDRVCHIGLLFKFKSIGVGGNALSICREFLSNHRQRVVVDGVTSLNPNCFWRATCVCWVFFCSSFIHVKCLRW